jgi:hypothetical protein
VVKESLFQLAFFVFAFFTVYVTAIHITKKRVNMAFELVSEDERYSTPPELTRHNKAHPANPRAVSCEKK